jgi:hypothetical protein
MIVNILVVLNTHYHIEVALGLYQIFKKNGLNPSIFIMPNTPVQYELLECMVECGIKFEKYVLNNKYDKAVVVSAYPTTHDKTSVPNINDIEKLFKKEDIILISHYMDPPQSEYKTICLSPVATKEYLILCENPFINNDNVEPQYSEIKRFLIQGNFQYGRKDLDYLDFFLENTQIPLDKFKIGMIGGIHDEEFIKRYGDNISLFSNVREIDFYRMVAQSDFILPLISKKTVGGYTEGRWSNSLYHSFTFNKPMIVDKEINNIYCHPSLEYWGQHSFLKKMEAAIYMSYDDYQIKIQQAKKYKLKLREYNSKFIRKLFY